MKGVEGKSQSLRRDVFWNATSEKVFLERGKLLPDPPTKKQYQLWALQDGNPIDMGVFSYAELSHIKNMGQIARADAFAITFRAGRWFIKAHHGSDVRVRGTHSYLISRSSICTFPHQNQTNKSKG
ncbi:MAG: anti-sigma factor [Owenweeksia sp.]|nr:anti-sigma factor [Owenweeksia sp.]